MRAFLFFIASALGSIAFQLSVALWPQYFRNYSWAIRYVWMTWFAVWAVWLATHPTLLGRLWKSPASTSELHKPVVASSVQDSFNPILTQTGPTLNVNLGFPSDLAGNRSTGEVHESKRNVVCLGAKIVNLRHDGYQGDSFHNTAAENSIVGVVACFRNDAVYGVKVDSVQRARSHLKFLNVSGTEIGTGVSRACWMGDKLDLLDGGSSGCVIVLMAYNGKLIVPWKERKRTWQGDYVVDRVLELAETPSAIEVSILDGNNQLVLAPILVDVVTEDGNITACQIR